MTEYSRTAVIAHISQATTGQQEGWGRPGADLIISLSLCTRSDQTDASNRDEMGESTFPDIHPQHPPKHE